MTTSIFSKYCLYFIVTISFAIWLLLAWGYFHGGIPAHHLFANPELPSVSNAWGALLIPLLTAYLSFRIQKRVITNNTIDEKELKKALLGFTVSVLYAISIALAFSFGQDKISDYLFRGLLVLALIFPLYKAHYYLGFVLGLTYFFGAVLPTLIGGVIVSISAIANFGLHPLIFKLKKFFTSKS